MSLGRVVVLGYYLRLGFHMILKAFFVVRLNPPKKCVLRYVRENMGKF